MKNNELQRILKEVQQQMQYTVLSYPERDPHGFKWGNPGYNGNCTGKIPLGFIDKLGAKSVFEMYAGSGTLSDVCRDYGIKYCGVDLNPNPVRDDIFFMDVCDLDQEFPLAIHDADFVFQHPVYPGIKRIKYANNAWKDTIGGLESKDIQNLPFYEGMKKINVGTELNKSYIEIVSRTFTAEDVTPLTSLRTLFQPANDRIKEIVIEKSLLFKL